MKSPVRCIDSSGFSKRVMIVAEVESDETMLAFYPESASGETVWLKKNDVATLVDKLTKWVEKRGGKSYVVPAVSGNL